MMNRWLVRLAACAALGAMTLGCSSSTTKDDASGIPARPATEAVATPPPSSNPSPNPWQRLALTGLEVEHYLSLEEMVGESNVALVGTVGAARFTRSFEESDGRETLVDRILEVRVSVERVLHGRVVDDAHAVRIEFGPYSAEEATGDLWAGLIGRRSVFVLRRVGAPVNLDPPRPDELAWKVYRLVCSQGLLDNTDGGTTLPMVDVVEPFERALRGARFDDVVARIARAG